MHIPHQKKERKHINYSPEEEMTVKQLYVDIATRGHEAPRLNRKTVTMTGFIGDRCRKRHHTPTRQDMTQTIHHLS